MYALRFGSRAVKELQNCSPDIRERVLDAVESLAGNPRPPGSKKLSGALAGSFRIRVGSYRVIYDIHDGKRAVLIAKIGPRKSIYR